MCWKERERGRQGGEREEREGEEGRTRQKSVKLQEIIDLNQE